MAISGEMDMDINILAGCFVIKKEKKNSQCYGMQSNIKIEKRKKERKKRGVGVGSGWGARGNIHQINTSVALIVICLPWLLLCHARQAAKRDLSMQS